MEIKLKQLYLPRHYRLEGSGTPVDNLIAQETKTGSETCVRSITLDDETGVIRIERFGTSKELYCSGGFMGVYDPEWQPKPGPGRPMGSKDTAPRKKSADNEGSK